MASAPSAGGKFHSPLDVEPEPVGLELTRVARLAEMALITDHTRMQDLGTEGSDDSVQDLHWLILPIAYPELWADFINRVDESGEGAEQ